MKRWASSAIIVLLLASPALAQPDTDKDLGMPIEPGSSVRSENGLPPIQATPGATAPSSASANPILHVPVTSLYPGNVNLAPHINNPLAGEYDAATRGMRDYLQFDCVGCHAPNGGGGMGPSLSDRRFIYGADPGDIFLSIYQGRPNGMPAWGAICFPNRRSGSWSPTSRASATPPARISAERSRVRPSRPKSGKCRRSSCKPPTHGPSPR